MYYFVWRDWQFQWSEWSKLQFQLSNIYKFQQNLDKNKINKKKFKKIVCIALFIASYSVKYWKQVVKSTGKNNLHNIKKPCT